MAIVTDTSTAAALRARVDKFNETWIHHREQRYPALVTLAYDILTALAACEGRQPKHVCICDFTTDAMREGLPPRRECAYHKAQRERIAALEAQLRIAERRNDEAHVTIRHLLDGFEQMRQVSGVPQGEMLVEGIAHRFDALQAQVRELRKALEKHGVHAVDCSACCYIGNRECPMASHFGNEGRHLACSCGLQAALASPVARVRRRSREKPSLRS